MNGSNLKWIWNAHGRLPILTNHKFTPGTSLNNNSMNILSRTPQRNILFKKIKKRLFTRPKLPTLRLPIRVPKEKKWVTDALNDKQSIISFANITMLKDFVSYIGKRTGDMMSSTKEVALGAKQLIQETLICINLQKKKIIDRDALTRMEHFLIKRNAKDLRSLVPFPVLLFVSSKALIAYILFLSLVPLVQPWIPSTFKKVFNQEKYKLKLMDRQLEALKDINFALKSYQRISVSDKNGSRQNIYDWDKLPFQLLKAMCQYMQVPTFCRPRKLLKSSIIKKLKEIRKDDQVLMDIGVETIVNPIELEQTFQMRSIVDVTHSSLSPKIRMEYLNEWIRNSLKNDIPDPSVVFLCLKYHSSVISNR